MPTLFKFLNKSINKEQGAVVAEFALVLPFMVFLFMGSLEYIRALQSYEAMAAFTKEAANASFRECMELDDRNDNIGLCLDSVIQRLNPSIQTVLPGLQLTLSIYAWEADNLGGTPSIKLKAMRPAGGQSKYSIATIDSSFLTMQGKIAIAEAYFQFVPFIAVPLGTDFYDATIY